MLCSYSFLAQSLLILMTFCCAVSLDWCASLPKGRALPLLRLAVSLVQGSHLPCLQPKWTVRKCRGSHGPSPCWRAGWCPPRPSLGAALSYGHQHCLCLEGLTGEAPHCLHPWPPGGYRVQAGCSRGDALRVHMSLRAQVAFKSICVEERGLKLYQASACQPQGQSSRPFPHSHASWGSLATLTMLHVRPIVDFSSWKNGVLKASLLISPAIP